MHNIFTQKEDSLKKQGKPKKVIFLIGDELFVFVQVARAATEGEKGKEKEVSVQHEKKKEVYSS